ncbi:MAG: hypothetical protein ACRDHS_14605 [Actinomycetota bacterium]
MTGASKMTRGSRITARIGWGVAVLAILYLLFAVVIALVVPGHWGDVAKISGVCLATGLIASWLIRKRARQG